MSDMSKSTPASADFTVRDLNRHLAKVLDACDRLGVIRIKRRQGQTYELRPQAPLKKTKKTAEDEWPDFQARARAMGMPTMTNAQREHLNRLIRGE
jgi:hypothetical protein